VLRFYARWGFQDLPLRSPWCAWSISSKVSEVGNSERAISLMGSGTYLQLTSLWQRNDIVKNGMALTL
jgi:hypothetical protein